MGGGGGGGGRGEGRWLGKETPPPPGQGQGSWSSTEFSQKGPGEIRRGGRTCWWWLVPPSILLPCPHAAPFPEGRVLTATCPARLQSLGHHLVVRSGMAGRWVPGLRRGPGLPQCPTHPTHALWVGRGSWPPHCWTPLPASPTCSSHSSLVLASWPPSGCEHGWGVWGRVCDHLHGTNEGLG